MFNYEYIKIFKVFLFIGYMTKASSTFSLSQSWPFVGTFQSFLSSRLATYLNSPMKSWTFHGRDLAKWARHWNSRIPPSMCHTIKRKLHLLQRLSTHCQLHHDGSHSIPPSCHPQQPHISYYKDVHTDQCQDHQEAA